MIRCVQGCGLQYTRPNRYSPDGCLAGCSRGCLQGRHRSLQDPPRHNCGALTASFVTGAHWIPGQFLPAADIATFVGAGNVDLGITGEDIVAENQVEDLVDVVTQPTALLAPPVQSI